MICRSNSIKSFLKTMIGGIIIITLLTVLSSCSYPECPECPITDNSDIIEAINGLEIECPNIECPNIECSDVDMTEVVEAIKELEIKCPKCPDYEFFEYEKVLNSTDVYTIIRNYWEYDIETGWVIESISSTYLGNGVWKSRVKFKSNINLIRYFYFNEITGYIR